MTSVETSQEDLSNDVIKTGRFLLVRVHRSPVYRHFYFLKGKRKEKKKEKKKRDTHTSNHSIIIYFGCTQAFELIFGLMESP